MKVSVDRLKPKYTCTDEDSNHAATEQGVKENRSPAVTKKLKEEPAGTAGPYTIRSGRYTVSKTLASIFVTKSPEVGTSANWSKTISDVFQAERRSEGWKKLAILRMSTHRRRVSQGKQVFVYNLLFYNRHVNRFRGVSSFSVPRRTNKCKRKLYYSE